MNNKRVDIFDLGTPVAAGQLSISAKHKDSGRFFEFPPISYLAWEEDNKHFIHCLDLDLIAEGNNEDQATRSLIDLIFEQMKLANDEGIQLFHPAPREYWDKFNQIFRNSLTQAFLDSRPRTSRDIKLTEQKPLSHVCA